MKGKSKWTSAVFVLLALVLALGAALTVAPAREPPAAEAGPLIWTTVEGDYPLHGLPTGVGQIIATAVLGNTVFVLANTVPDPAAPATSIQVVRSDDGGYRWEPPRNVIIGAGTTGVAIAISPNYTSDGTVLVLATDRIVYASTDKGVTWPVANATFALPIGVVPSSLAISPVFNALASGGQIVVGGTFVAGTCTWYETWQGPTIGWVGAWTVIPVATPGTNCLAIGYAPTSSLRLMGVFVDGAFTYGSSGSISSGFPANNAGLPGTFVFVDPNAGSLRIHLGPATGAVIALGSDYNPISTVASPNAPMEFFVGTVGVVGVSSIFWFNPTLAVFQDLRVVAGLPVLPTSGLVASGTYTRAILIVGSSAQPITYNCDVRSLTWSTPVFIEGNGGAIGTVSGTVGVLLAYTGSGNTVYAATTDLVTAFTIGDLTGLSRSDDFADSWGDTCLTGEDFTQNVLDMVWLDALTGIIVCDDFNLGFAPPFNVESTFKTWDQGISWKRVDRWQDVTQVARAPDGTIVLLDTGTTGNKVLVSNDSAETFTPTAADPVILVTTMMSAIAAGSATDIVVGDIAGHLYWTNTGGSSWTDAGAVGAFVHSLEVPDEYATVSHVAAGMTSSAGMMEVFLSTDRGASWTQVGTSTQVGAWGPVVGYMGTAFSGTYGTDSLLYNNTMGAAADDIYRTDTSGDLATAGWMPLGAGTSIGAPGAAIAAIDMVYYAALDGVEDLTGNILYATSPGVGVPMAATYSPESVNWQFPFNTLWGAFAPDAASSFTRPGVLEAVVGSSIDIFTVDTVATAPIDRVRSWTGTTGYLTPPVLLDPIGGKIVPSNNLATGDPVELTWAPVIGALLYNVQVSKAPSRLYAVAAPVVGVLTEVSIGVGTLSDGQTYYWQVRVASTLMGAYTGPYSDWQTFTVEAVELHVAPTLIKPVAAAVDVAVRPLFQWSGIEDATNFQLQVDEDPTFGSPVIDETLGVQQTYQPAVALDWEETYSWRVKGVGLDWETTWSESIFVTIPEWAEPSPAVTPVWVWIVIVLGAIVAIVVIVLIVRTRRPV